LLLFVVSFHQRSVTISEQFVVSCCVGSSERVQLVDSVPCASKFGYIVVENNDGQKWLQPFEFRETFLEEQQNRKRSTFEVLRVLSALSQPERT
jgi:hypothetical protein|tara:strand:- start:75 stop:356 length:282 start_codon:yes stop_codon:yes gene_type:complete